MSGTVETDRRSENVNLDKLLEIVNLMQSTIDLTADQSHRGRIVPYDFPKIKDSINEITYGIKVEYREKDQTGSGNGIIKAIFSKIWTWDSVYHSSEVTLYLDSTLGPRIHRLELVNDIPNGLKTTKEFSGVNKVEASVNLANFIAERYLFLQSLKA